MDPDSGAKPPEGGASAGMRAEGKPSGKSSRRRKAKRPGKNRNAAQAPLADAASSAAGNGRPENGRPENAEPDAHARKRKRRRSKSRPSQNNPAGEAQATASEQPALRQNVAGAEPAAEQSRGRRRKKNRGGRGLQGRPLAQSRASASVSAKSATAKSPDGGSRPVHGKDAGNGRGGQSGAHPQSAAAHKLAPVREELYAALDLGTNNCRLLIAQPTRPGQFRVVDAFSRIVRLGEGLAATGRLSQDAMDRAVEALRICAGKLANKPIRRMRLIATEACRAATNGEEFLARVKRETGLSLEIIDRETEARLAVSGCSSLVGREARSVVLFDIGGGSSEIAVIRIDDNRSSRLANHITHWTSLPVGVVTLSERHGGRDVTNDVFAAMVAEVEGMLSAFECPPVGPSRRTGAEDFYLIGTSGTVTTLAGLHLGLSKYDRRKVDGVWLTDAEVGAMQDKLLSWGFADRAANPCIGADRADLVLAGCAILEAIRRRWPSPRMRVADRGLREGLLTDMMADDGVWRRIRARRGSGSNRDEGHAEMAGHPPAHRGAKG